MTKQKTYWTKDPEDIRYQSIRALVQSLPVVGLYVVVSALAQAHTNNNFDANEIKNLVEGAPAMAIAYAVMKLRKMI